ncbi:MAG: manganese efflux pump MntP family protein [Oscillospiraceae bacterium]|jgi:putative Mn2+ efflux pump MntP|nr:manganese efflux pump MntP family protein [Oscillospiraceae bacterium]
MWSVVLIGLALSADAFAVSVANGIAQRGARFKGAVITGFFFGLFQAVMPFLGWAVGGRFAGMITAYDHWVVLALLTFVGGKMLIEAIKLRKDPLSGSAALGLKYLLVASIATSIDALAVGVGFAFGTLWAGNIFTDCLLIGGITFAVCFAGFLLGKRVGAKYKTAAEIGGGLVLIGIGIKTVVEHLAA